MVIEFERVKFLPIQNKKYSHPKNVRCRVVPKTGCWECISHTTANNYPCFRPVIKGVRKIYYLHRLSYEAFKGEIPKGMCVLHSCDNPLCINPEHLFLGTGKDNVLDMVNKERQARGEKNNHAKLTIEQVRAIRLNEMSTIAELAQKYGVCTSNIYQIKAYKTWKHVQFRKAEEKK